MATRTRRALALCGLALCVTAAGCASSHARKLRRASRDAGKQVRRGDAVALRERVVPGARNRVDYEAIMAEQAERSEWSGALARPVQTRPEALVFLSNEQPVRAVETDGGWAFAEDPTVRYDQSTPRAALRSLVLASRMKRWDVLLELAPERYRVGLTVEALEQAWTEGEYAKDLATRRDRLSRRLAEPIVADAHMATLALGDGAFALLERERHRWVVIDF